MSKENKRWISCKSWWVDHSEHKDDNGSKSIISRSLCQTKGFTKER
jgi:hypothetical protein